MALKNGKFCGFAATPKEVEIIDRVMRKNYTMSKSDVIRLLINEGAKNLLAEKKPKAEAKG